jgi:hypothetical protein
MSIKQIAEMNGLSMTRFPTQSTDENCVAQEPCDGAGSMKKRITGQTWQRN